MKALTNKLLGGKEGALGLAVLAIIIFIVLPLGLDVFRLNLVGKYLTYAFVAVSLVLLWGNGGILSLGQGIFFGLGGYCMAMFLKLEASDPISTKIQTTPGIPDFMDWNQITALPWFWKPFESLPFTILAILVIPTVFAGLIGYAMFKRRVGGVLIAQNTFCTFLVQPCYSALSFYRGMSYRASLVCCYWRCATKKSVCASLVTMFPTLKSLSSV
jgi:urea transport system permease protein